ncbi:unnamed protein product [Danaus chrysippus]|uniref:(African queen) hypothetical protein n=1 Tax=Danaus chrysippus TaxID=151541 RepID=A0A8J2Q5G1_9NEOP|nr:unnamed protein product [Danaus chrysippus]
MYSSVGSGSRGEGPGAVAAGAGLRPRPSPTTSISSSESSASSVVGATFHFLAMRQRGMAAPASASARPHQRETDEQRKREKRERAAPRASGVAGDRARPLALWRSVRRHSVYIGGGVVRALPLRSMGGGCSTPHKLCLPTWSDTYEAGAGWSDEPRPNLLLAINQWKYCRPYESRTLRLSVYN